jgi:signal transduction histidine kinase
LSFAAVLVPAAGLAYLGGGSYRADRGLVASKLDEHNRAAREVAGAAEQRLRETLDAAAELFRQAAGEQPSAEALAALRSGHPMAKHPFQVGADGRMRYAVADPLERNPSEPIVDASFSPKALRTAKRRIRLLETARRRELALCAGVERATCAPDSRDIVEVRRAYAALVGFDGTGPDALLALARLDLLMGDGTAAVRRYDALRDRYGEGMDVEGLGYDLIAALGRAEATREPSEIMAVYRGVVVGDYRAPPPALLAIGDLLRERLRRHTLLPPASAEVRALDAKLAEAREYAQFVDELDSEAETVMRTALEQLRGRPALHHVGRTLVYRREPDGSIVGVVVDEAVLDAAAQAAQISIVDPEPSTRAIVARLGAPPHAEQRVLSTAGFGTVLPHLTVSIVNDRSMPDPLDEIVRARGRRHLLLTGGLVSLLLIGVWATIRSAARERELARLKSDFVSTVSHELKTPLTSIRMFAEMLQQGVAGGDRDRESRYHDIIVSESERLGLLIANVLDYSQIERGTRRYTFEEDSVSEVAGEAVETFRRLREGEQSDVVFEVDPEAADARVKVDRAVVVQSLLNLLANAAKYGGKDHPIDIRVCREDGDVRISVRDRGPGIPSKEHAAIFREFYRAPEAYSLGVEGTGLGLALVKRHVEALGGRVVLDSAVGRGATFSIVLPEVNA